MRRKSPQNWQYSILGFQGCDAHEHPSALCSLSTSASQSITGSLIRFLPPLPVPHADPRCFTELGIPIATTPATSLVIPPTDTMDHVVVAHSPSPLLPVSSDCPPVATQLFCNNCFISAHPLPRPYPLTVEPSYCRAVPPATPTPAQRIPATAPFGN